MTNSLAVSFSTETIGNLKNNAANTPRNFAFTSALCKHAWRVHGLCLCKQQHSSKAEDHLIHCSLIVSPKMSVSIDYRPQRRCHSVQRRGFCHTPWEANTSLGRHPPQAGRPPPGRHPPPGKTPGQIPHPQQGQPLQWTVRIVLECILVKL